MNINKTLVTTALLVMFGSATPMALAQANHAGHHGGASASAGAEAKLAEGTVKRIDMSANKLTIAHGPLETVNMPAMTMAFRTAAPGMLDQVKAGDKIRFAVEKVGGVLTVTAIEAAR